MLVNALANRRSALAVGYAEAGRPINRTRCRSFSYQEMKCHQRDDNISCVEAEALGGT